MKAFTDYPFSVDELDDAPVREVEVVSWDGDKYVAIQVGKAKYEIKYGYLYKEAGRLGQVPQFTPADLADVPVKNGNELFCWLENRQCPEAR